MVVLRANTPLPASSFASTSWAATGVPRERAGRVEKPDVLETTRSPGTPQRKKLWGFPGLIKQAWEGVKTQARRLKQALLGPRDKTLSPQTKQTRREDDDDWLYDDDLSCWPHQRAQRGATASDHRDEVVSDHNDSDPDSDDDADDYDE